MSCPHLRIDTTSHPQLGGPPVLQKTPICRLKESMQTDKKAVVDAALQPLGCFVGSFAGNVCLAARQDVTLVSRCPYNPDRVA